MASVLRVDAEKSKPSPSHDLIPFEFAPVPHKTIDALIDLQKVLVDAVDDTNRA
jgi:hypothetical protein